MKIDPKSVQKVIKKRIHKILSAAQDGTFPAFARKVSRSPWNAPNAVKYDAGDLPGIYRPYEATMITDSSYAERENNASIKSQAHS